MAQRFGGNNSTSDGKFIKISGKDLRKAFPVFQFIRPYRWHFIGGMVLLTLSSLIFMVFPGAAGEMANAANGKPKFPIAVKDYGWLFLVILIAQGVISYFRTNLFAIVSEKGMADIRKAVYEKLLTQPITFFENRRIGELTSRITGDVEKLQNALSITFAEFIRQFVVLIAGVAILAWLTPRLSLIMIMTFPIIVVLAIVFGRYIRRLSKERQDKLADTNTIVEETLQTFAVVKAFTNEWVESRRYGKSVDSVVDISLEFARVRGIFFIFIITVMFGGIFFILWQGALMVEKGQMQVGDLFSFIVYTGIIGGAIAGIGNLYTEMAGAVGATERILDILNNDSEVNLEDSKNGFLTRINGDISFQNVQFSYPSRSDVEVLKGVNIDVKAGQKVAVVGTSGAGKSTIMQLLLRFHQFNGGQILADGKPIEDYNITAYRQNFAIVPQEVLLFGGTIKENIGYGKPNATDAEIDMAARQSNSLDFIQSFPEGMNTVVGERGIKLSGGQRQRIAIARAILRNPTVLLLDEATSSLDAESERVVQEALNKLMEGRTSIIIAHRLATIKDVDRIFVLDGGKVVEQGTHDELTSIENGVYSGLARLQMTIAGIEA
jgi:ATP-binding cassette, subfamily B, bacterial